MIGAPDLLARPRALVVAPQPSVASVNQAIASLRSRRVPNDGPPPRLRYPGNVAGMKGVAAALETARKHDSSEFAMLADVAKDPARGYPLTTNDPAVNFGDSLEELRLQLDEPEAESMTVVETWDHFSERVQELEHSGFVLTAACHQMLIANAYPEPGGMWRFTKILSRAARDWRELGGEVGNRLADWIAENYEIEVALHDAGLGSWAEFTFEGREYSREPHVKVDDFKNPMECGRVYFAVDSDGLRFIVDHIGLHP